MPPAVSSINPSQGSVSGGTTVTITGTNLTGATAVRFGASNAASYSVNSSTQITASTPAGSPGSVPVTVVSPSGTSNTTVSFTYTAVLPTVTAVSPATGPASGGTAVTLTGTNFTGATAVRFGSDNAPSFTVTSSTRITTVSPSGSPGAVPVTVTTPSGTSASAAAAYFFYVPAPFLTEISPSAGPTGGNNNVTLKGANLSNATAVRFGAAVSTFTSVSSTEVTAKAPPGSGVADITVSTPGGSSNPLAYAYVGGPVLLAVSPTSGPASGGAVVTLLGTGFTTTTAVKVGASPVSYVVLSDGELTAVVPPGPSGAVPLVVTTVGGTSEALTFVRVEAPVV
ncbi:IPT/TIG domain-containing protein [Streptomyces humidus]|uniref:IPT/TIG domain-containing protein n=1 Tax=Streptomyces humidus TaxID=52259 RepID=UPI003324301A